MTRTYLILDGLQQPELGQALSRAWAKAGFDNAVDVGGQSAWVSAGTDTATPRRSDEGEESLSDAADGDFIAAEALTEVQIDHAAAIARVFGLEVRDRAGESFIAANDLSKLRGRIIYEYKSRFATAIMFGLPALALHWFGEFLAGGAQSPRDMLYPWLIEMLLVGWVCIAAGWPILWQGALSLRGLRMTNDLLTSFIIFAAFVPSALFSIGVIIGVDPPFALRGPTFHAALLTVTLVVWQRFLLHRAADKLAGKAMLMLPGFNRIIGVWMIAFICITVFVGWRAGLAFAMLLPAVASSASINPWTPGWPSLMPTFAFALMMLLDPGTDAFSLEGIRIEVAAGFGVIQGFSAMWGWRKV